jgi:WD40 domain-containing protein
MLIVRVAGPIAAIALSSLAAFGESPVNSAAFSPDGSRIVTASSDNTARIWDAATAKEIAVLRGHEDIVSSAAFSPDGSRIVTASWDNTARIWDAATAKEIAVVRGHEGPVQSAAFSPDGSRLVTAGDKTARVWDAHLQTMSANGLLVQACARLGVGMPCCGNATENHLKRLLDTDRSLGTSAKSTDPEKATYAFFSQDAAGSGIEVRFQEYEAFALLTGWRFLEHGFPQQKAVLALRRMRPLLEQEHARIMQLDPNALFDQQRIRAEVQEGQMYLNNTAPVFLVVSSSEEDSAKTDERSIKSVTICRTEADLMRFIKSHFGLKHDLRARRHVTPFARLSFENLAQRARPPKQVRVKEDATDPSNAAGVQRRALPSAPMKVFWSGSARLSEANLGLLARLRTGQSG